jgi:tyrosine-protein phosphatase SIW14
MTEPAQIDRFWRSPRVWLAACLLLVGMGLFYRFEVRDNLFPPNFGVVEPGVLYRSAALSPAGTRRVHDQYHIKTIIDLGAYEPGSPEEAVAARTAEALGVKRQVFRLEGDGTGNPNAYVAALRVITDPSNQPVLVHCSAGAQRTSACVMLYRSIVQGKDMIGPVYEDSFRYGHDPRRNTRLAPYLMEFREKIAQAYRTGSTIGGFEPMDRGRVERGVPESAVRASADPAVPADGTR